jgi:carboxyl-terminal processing protease
MKITNERKVLLVISAALIVFTLSGALLGRISAVEGTYGSLKVFNEALYLVVNNYVQPIEIEELMEGSYRGLLETLDPGNEYLDPERYRQAVSGEPARPASIGVTLSKLRGYVVVVAVAPDSPAAAAGLKTGDLLINIDGRPTRRMGVWEATRALRGESNTEVKVVVNPVGGTDRKTEIFVRRLLLPPAPTGTYQEPDVGIVKIHSIRKGDARRLDGEIGSLRAAGAGRLMLDLRGCESDNMAETIGMASLFIEDGTIVTVTDRHDGDKAFRADGRRLAWEGPLAILVDEGTARTCEVLAAALRDRLDVPLLGEQTWGIGAVHALLPLRNGDGVFLAVGRYLSPSGKDWNGSGLEPDHEIVGNEQGDDEQRRRAIDFLRGISSSPAAEAA